MKRRHFWKFAFIFVLPLALYAFIVERNSWRPKMIVIAPNGGIYNFQFSPNQNYLLAYTEKGCYLYNVRNRQNAFLPFDTNWPVVFLKDDFIVATLEKIREIDRPNFRDMPLPKNIPIPDKIKLIQPPEKFIFLGILADNKTMIGQIVTNKNQMKCLPKPNELWSWNINSKEKPRLYLDISKGIKNQSAFAATCQLLPDKKTLLVDYSKMNKFGSPETAFSGYYLWNLDTKKSSYLPIKVDEPREILGSAANNNLFLYDFKGHVQVWNYKTLRRFRMIDLKRDLQSEIEICLSSNGKFIGLNDVRYTLIFVWDANSGELLRKIPANYGSPLVFTPDCCHIAVRRDNGNVQTWRIR